MAKLSTGRDYEVLVRKFRWKERRVTKKKKTVDYKAFLYWRMGYLGTSGGNE